MRGRFKCAHVWRFLDPEDLVQKIKRGRCCFGRHSRPEREICSRRKRRCGNRRLRTRQAEIQFGHNRWENDGLWLNLGAAVLQTIAGGHLVCHGAIRSHAARGHRAPGSTVRVHSRCARQPRHRRQNRNEANHQNGDELGELSHVLTRGYGSDSLQSVFWITSCRPHFPN